MWLHWLIAALLIYNYALGERTEHLKPGAALFAVLQLHKSIGITVLLLSLWRLAIRLWRPLPAAVIDSPSAKYLSSAVHALFYVVMIAAPLTGWIIVSTAKIKIPTLLFGLIPLPHLPLAGMSHALHELAEEAHGLLSRLMLGLIALHVIGALRHQFMMKDRLFDRMMPTVRASWGAFAVAVALLGGSFALGRVGPIPGLADTATPIASGNATPANAKTETPVTTPENADLAKNEPDAADEANRDAEKTLPAGSVPKWQQLPGGQLGFNVTANGDQISGRFSNWSSNIVFDPERLDQSSIRATIDLASVASGDGERDAMLAGSDFFAIAAHPQATFASASIRGKGGNRYEARGNLTLKGISRPVRLNFTLDINGDQATAKGTATLSRGAFSVGVGQFEGDETISKNVSVNFNFTARKR